jgi:hypothetical protein
LFNNRGSEKGTRFQTPFFEEAKKNEQKEGVQKRGACFLLLPDEDTLNIGQSVH